MVLCFQVFSTVWQCVLVFILDDRDISSGQNNFVPLRHPIKNGWFPQNGWFIMKIQWKWMIWWYLISGHLHLVVKAT